MPDKPEKRVEQERERVQDVVEQANEPAPPQSAPTSPKVPGVKERQ